MSDEDLADTPDGAREGARHNREESHSESPLDMLWASPKKNLARKNLAIKNLGDLRRNKPCEVHQPGGQEYTVDISRYSAAIFDMDGVVTRTATVHARAWKEMFDEFLQRYSVQRGEPFVPFDEQNDYFAYVDGLPRHDGVRSFLAARGIELPEGEHAGSAREDTIHGLGSRKDALVRQVLARDGVEVFPDWLEKVKDWRRAGVKTAIVSSSLNCRAMIQAAGIEELFDARVDGAVAHELGLKGKPDADIFLEAARQLGAAPDDCVVFEDAISGVQAGAAGGFGLVVGVARHGNHATLIEHGADLSVTALTQLT